MANKIEEKELESLQENQNQINQLLNKIGLFYLQKINAEKVLDGSIDESKDLSEKQGSIKKDLEQKYGKISVDLTSGEYSEISDENSSEISDENSNE
tara:strand:+ start:89 stop:379 length:291 start_codon:yes stop_codon:yes gene_type:complete